MIGVIGGGRLIWFRPPWVDEGFEVILALEKGCILLAPSFDYLEKALHALVAVVLFAVCCLFFELGYMP